MSFSKRLQRLIDEKKISAAELAREIGVDRSQVSNWLSGKTKKPRRKTVFAIADFFNCDASWLAQGVGEMSPGDLNQLYKHLDKTLKKHSRHIDPFLLEIEDWLASQEIKKPYIREWFIDSFLERFPEFAKWIANTPQDQLKSVQERYRRDFS